MRALQLKVKGERPELIQIEGLVPGTHQKLVKLKAASLNHRDVWIMKGMYPNLTFPIIPGSDGAGVVDGQEVVIQPGTHWGADERFQEPGYQILGLPKNGTFAEQVIVDEHQIYPKPSHLSMEQAAALPLAGLTAYRVLFTRCKAQPGEKLLITGAGGGVAMFCCQFALKLGLEVYVTSGSDHKIAKAKAQGVAGTANYRSTDWVEQLRKQAGGFDIIIDGAGGSDFSNLVKLCNPGGRIGIYGGTLGGVPNFSPQPIFWKQLSILGSTMGSDKDFAEMLDFVNQQKVVPVIDAVYELENGAAAFERMEQGHQFGKIILRIE